MTSRSVTRPRGRFMSRSRMIFFLFIAIILAVLAWSLRAQIIDSQSLMQMYIAATILSVGVIVIDMIGLLGDQHGDEGSGYDPSDVAGGDHGLDIDDGVHFGHDDSADMFDAHMGDHDGIELDYTGDDDAVGLNGGHDDAGHDGDDDFTVIGNGPVLEAIRYLRMFVYFCLGFGLVGLAALLTSRPALSSLLFAGIAGVCTVALARTFYRFQPRDTGTELSDDELLMEHGTVIVPLSDKTMGKVRVTVGIEVRDVYAYSAYEDVHLERGVNVRIVKLGDSFVYVEEV